MTSYGDHQVCDKQTETLRSDFLIHWTGKDIQTNYKTLCGTQRQEYIHRLHTTLDRDSGGLWMRKMEMELDAKFCWPATCFTEIKLSDTEKHTERYGCLGFGFSRKFVMERFGAPVQYVAGKKERDMEAEDNISLRLSELLLVSNFLTGKTLEPESPIIDHKQEYKPQKNCHFAKFIKGCRLEKLEQEWQDKKELAQYLDRYTKCPSQVFAYLRAAAMSCGIFVKKMSDEKCDHAFELLDEAEWRIPYTDEMANKDGRQKIWKTGLADPPYKIPFTRDDLKILILPDEKTRKLAFDEEDTVGKDIVEWLFEKPAEVPIIATVKECLQF